MSEYTNELDMFMLRLGSGLGFGLERIWHACTGRERLIVTKRFVDTPKKTLQEIGNELQLTRERVRQLELKIVERYERGLGDQIRTIKEHLINKFDAMIPVSEYTKLIDTVLRDVSERDKAIFSTLLVKNLKYTLRNGYYLSPTGEFLISTFVHYINSNNLLLVDELVLANHNLEFWYKYRNEIKQCLGLVKLRYGSYARLASVSTRVLDTLKHFGIPATKEQIAQHSGIPLNKLKNRLRLIQGVVKVSNNTWALGSSKQSQYVGVVDEMLRILERNDGAVSVQFLKAEIKRTCNVKDTTINAYLYTPQFVIKNHTVRLSTHADIQLRPLAQTIDGRTGSGAPYWLIKVKERHLKGHSVVGLPPELARFLKLEPNTRARIPIQFPLDCRDMSVTWRLASTTGLQIGYLADVFRKLHVSSGDQVRLIIRGGSKVGFERHFASN